MSMSGIKLTDECIEVYKELLEKKMHRYVILGFKDDKFQEVVVKTKGAKDSTFDQFLAELPSDHIAYVFYDCHYKTTAGQDRTKVLMVTWSSDDHAPLKEKMLCSSTESEVKKKCLGYAKAQVINDRDELTEENFINLVSDNRSK